jgi:hypothetical protein
MIKDLDSIVAEHRDALASGRAGEHDRFFVRMLDPDTGERLYDSIRWTGPDGAQYEEDANVEVVEITAIVHGKV